MMILESLILNERDSLKGMGTLFGIIWGKAYLKLIEYSLIDRNEYREWFPDMIIGFQGAIMT